MFNIRLYTLLSSEWNIINLLWIKVYMGQSKVILNDIPQILLSSDNVVLLSCDNGIRADLKSVVQQCIGSSNLSLSVLIKYE